MSRDADRWRERGLRDAVLAGDRAAWGRWLAEAFPAVAGYARWRCGGAPDLADDILQETWLIAARRLGRFDPDKGPFAGWVCGIAAGVVANHLRARARDRRRARPLGAGPEPAAPGADGAAADRAERVAVALARLPPRYEQALRAKYLDQQSVAAIAAGWGETEKAVESVLSRARQAFREAFDRPAEDV